MYRIPGVLSAATTPARPRPTRGPPPAPEGDDIVIRRLVAAGLDLQNALGLLGDHPARVQIRHAIEELDQVIQAVRDQPRVIRDE
jgi:hypothetical protein